MLFEYDPQKSSSNQEKHGIDFEEAQRIWDDPHLLEIAARTVEEPRWIVLGTYRSKVWACVITRRSDRVRIISVRRARDEEKALYESD